MVASTQQYECDAVTVTRDANCVEVADEMDANTVGCVVVVMEGAPVGIITDRDLVCRVVALDRDPEKTRADEIMTRDLVTTERKDDIEQLLKVMEDRKIRRVPIVADGMLVGIVSLDDVLVQISSYLFNANRGILGGLQEGRRVTRHRRRSEAREDALEELRRQLSEFGDQTQKVVHDAMTEILDRFGLQRKEP